MTLCQQARSIVSHLNLHMLLCSNPMDTLLLCLTDGTNSRMHTHTPLLVKPHTQEKHHKKEKKHEEPVHDDTHKKHEEYKKIKLPVFNPKPNHTHEEHTHKNKTWEEPIHDNSHKHEVRSSSSSSSNSSPTAAATVTVTTAQPLQDIAHSVEPKPRCVDCCWSVPSGHAFAAQNLAQEQCAKPTCSPCEKAPSLVASSNQT